MQVITTMSNIYTYKYSNTTTPITWSIESFNSSLAVPNKLFTNSSRGVL